MSIRSKNILYASSDSLLAAGNNIANRSSKGFPFVRHNNGHVCWPINDYLLHRFRKLHHQVGTVRDVANSLSLLVRFIDEYNINLLHIYDHTLVSFRDYLINEHSKGGPSQVNKHIRYVVNFLFWLDKNIRTSVSGKSKILISFDDDLYQSQVKISRKENENQHRKQKKSESNFTHESLLRESIPVKQFPFSTGDIDKLWKAIPKICSSTFRVQRDELALLLFETTGGRRGELFNIKVKEALLSVTSKSLRIITLKHTNEEKRDIPISDELARRINNYISYTRKKVITESVRKGKIVNDHGLLLINSNGKPWKSKSFNEEIALLKKAAHLENPAHPHLFRHYKFSLVSKETENLPNSKRLLMLKNLGGWRSDQSPAIYIQEMEEHSKGWIESINKINNRQNINQVQRKIFSLISEIKKNISDITVLDNADELEILIRNLFDTG